METIIYIIGATGVGPGIYIPPVWSGLVGGYILAPGVGGLTTIIVMGSSGPVTISKPGTWPTYVGVGLPVFPSWWIT